MDAAWEGKKASFIVLYGRRRIGKSRLIQEFIREKPAFYHIADDINPTVQIADFRKKLAPFLGDDLLGRHAFNTWPDLFEYLTKIIPRDKPMILAIDEFSYWVKNDASILSALQKFWDTFLSQTRVMLVVSGSLFGLMSESVLSAASPLYGRRDRDILLGPLDYRDAIEFLPMNPTDQLKTLFAVGGVPEYLLKASRFRSAEAFFNNEFFQKDGYFYREPYYILSREFKEIKTYFTLLNAISIGNAKPVDIAHFAGIRHQEIYPYMENLIRLGFVKRETPTPGKAKNGTYAISDTVFDFWFNFVHPRRELIEKGMFQPDANQLNAYFGKRFEDWVRGHLLHGFTPFAPTRTGRWWHKAEEIDAVAMDEPQGRIAFAECKWKDRVNASEVAKQLDAKTPNVQWRNDDREETLMVFAKSFSKKISEFDSKPVICVDLADIAKTSRVSQKANPN